MLVHKYTYFFSIQQLLTQRIKFQHKICYRADQSELKLKSTPTISLASRLFRDGNNLTVYKNCNKFYIQLILKNIETLSQNNEFKNLFYQYQSFTDFNRVLFWRLSTINSLFNLKKLKKKKLLYYLKTERRLVTVLLWLKYIIKSKKLNYHNNTINLFKPLINFICANKPNNEAYSLKLKIYRLRVLKG